jgi:hypothetical protein
MLHVVMAPALLSKPKIIFGDQTKLPSETTVSTTAPRQMLSSTYGEYNSPVRVLQIETRYPIRYYAVGSGRVGGGLLVRDKTTTEARGVSSQETFPGFM